MLKKNEININHGLLLCQEPPGGASVTWNKLIFEKSQNDLYILIADYRLKIIDRFKLLKIEYIDNKINERPYRLTLLRMKQ